MGSSTVPARGTRPPNRRSLIVTAATTLFARDGYEYVGMSEVADAVAVRPSALYRHFPSKEAILVDIIRIGVSTLEQAVDDLDISAGRDGLKQLAGTIIANRDAAALVGRETAHLGTGSRREVRQSLARVGRTLADKLRGGRPGATADEASVLAWALLAVLRTPAFAHSDLRDTDCIEHLTELSARLLTVSSPLELGTRRAPAVRGIVHASRREALLAEAIALFAERSYTDVGIEEVGAALGIAGPSIYNHFKSKSEILATALSRGSAYLSLQVADTLATTEHPAVALERLTRGYVDFAFAHPALIDLMISETRSLPPQEQQATVAAQRTHILELAALLQRLDSGLGPSQARLSVSAGLMIGNDIARIPRLRAHDGAPQVVGRLIGQLLTPRTVV